MSETPPNRRPIVYDACGGYQVWPWWVRVPGTSYRRFGSEKGLYWLGMVLAMTGAGFIPGMYLVHVASKRAEEDFLARHGWTPTGPDRTRYGHFKSGVMVERYGYGPNPQIPPAAR